MSKELLHGINGEDELQWRRQDRYSGPARRAARRAVLTATLATLVLLSPAASQVASADFPGANGRITFMRTDDAGRWQVWVASAGLTGQKQITDGAANNGWAVWSAKGGLIAFDSDRDDPDPGDSDLINDIFVMRADGSGTRKVTDSVGFSETPSWSPDGSMLAFAADRGDYPARQGIYVSNRDGSHLRRVTTLPSNATYDGAPRFSPDGKHLVFTRFRGDQPGNSALFTVSPTGRHLHRLTPFAVGAGDADWSPDSRWLVFEASPTGSWGELDVVRSDGAHLRHIISEGALVSDPVWSPDGRQILFLLGVVRGDEIVRGLATMKPDGAGRHFLESTPVESHQPDWQSIP